MNLMMRNGYYSNSFTFFLFTRQIWAKEQESPAILTNAATLIQGHINLVQQDR
jgi:hypothetical protein